MRYNEIRRMNYERVNFAWLRTFKSACLRKFSRFRPLKMRERYQPIIATTAAATLHKKGRQEKGCPLLYSNITSYAMNCCLIVCLSQFSSFYTFHIHFFCQIQIKVIVQAYSKHLDAECKMTL